MGTYHDIRIPARRRSGVSGTETFLSGSLLLQLQVYNSGAVNASVVMPDGKGGNGVVTVQVPPTASWTYQTIHGAAAFGGAGNGPNSLQLVMNGTASYFIEYLPPPQGE